ncbi:MAG: helix-turn-helix domain-containing protein [bacterium]|nr:helix-turn-helix domain-containing protein [bacterium]MCP4967328.1 helix-turn-helix domain-containing protein [bacterium]
MACSVAETAEMLSVGTWLIYELIHTKQLRSLKAGRRRLIPRASIERFLDEGAA